jgi:hypothetical protein
MILYEENEADSPRISTVTKLGRAFCKQEMVSRSGRW